MSYDTRECGCETKGKKSQEDWSELQDPGFVVVLVTSTSKERFKNQLLTDQKPTEDSFDPLCQKESIGGGICVFFEKKQRDMFKSFVSASMSLFNKERDLWSCIHLIQKVDRAEWRRSEVTLRSEWQPSSELGCLNQTPMFAAHRSLGNHLYSDME